MLASLLAVGVSTGLAGGRPTDGPSAPTVDAGSALVQLEGAPLATAEKTRPPKGKKIDFSSQAVRSYRAELSELRNDFKAWLRQNAPGARVNGEFDISLNAVSVELNGTSLGTITGAPMVESAQLQGLYRPAAHDDPDLELIHAQEAWSSGNGAKGEGVDVAIVDSGIDTRHPCFGSGSTNGGTNAKVIFADVFHMKAQNQGYTPADENGHGTHVAGTVACNEHTPATMDGVDIPYDPSGVAPAARLGNFNVFPADVASARSEDIVDALEEAYEQGFEVANMSLGGGQGGVNDLLAKAVDNLDAANMVVAVAAGNSGPGFSTVESPGIAPGALTAGAMTVGHFVGVEVTRGAVTARAAAGDFETVEEDLTRPVTAPAGTGVAGLSQACTAFAPNSMTGTIALVARGVCTFETKIRNAGAAGADAVIVVNNVGGDPIAMGDDTAIPGIPETPAYMVSQDDGTALKAAAGTATIEAARTYFLTGNHNIMAGFSGQGPTDVDFRVKPDVVAPGVNVLSSQPNEACETPPCWAFFQGTSMATPHLAGAAALVRSQHPTWSAAEIRSAITNTADQGVLLNSTGSGVNTNVNIIGAGRANAFSATTAQVALAPVSVSFGSVASGSGQSASKTVALTTLTGSGPYAVEVTDETGNGVDFDATISGNTITVTMAANRRAAAGSRQGILRVRSGGTEIAHAAVFAFIK
jgi:minor extracellular serine protease Vpr